ncbi:inner centromere protein A-like isoform X2 [Ptychodera flava]|uniref:inner centromere protein A-like isoform X2 n=1 Tax=Ptychodera flava TaxID=63121 RepID=UPI00396A05D7
MPPIETNHVSRDLGFALHQVTTKKLKDFLHSFENDHMKWLEEILVVAKESFQRTKEPELLPKTPSVKNRRKRRLRKDNEENLPLSKKRRSQSLASKRSSARRSVLAKVTEEAESKEEEDGDAHKSKENKKKVKITETTSEDMLIQQTAGYDAQTAEKERNNLVVQELAEKTSEARKTSTPPPETRKPRRGASRAATLRLKRQLDSEEQTCTPPQMTRMTRTASRTALQRSRLGSLRNKANTTSQEASNTGVAGSNEGAVSESVTEDLASKSKWAPKIELRHVIQSSKVKKLIHVHEEYIVASSSDDEHTPPKRLRLANGKKGRMEPLKEKPEENNSQGIKFFPPVSTAGGESTMSSASEKDTSVVTVKVSDSDEVTSASSDTGSGKEGNPTSAATPEETDCGTSQEVICISTSQDEGSAGSQQDEGRPAESTCDISHKSEEKTKPCSESSSEEVTKETAEKEETFEDSLDDKGDPDIEPDSLIEEPVRRQLRSRTMSVSTMKSEDDDSAGQQKRPNRAIRTKQRKGRKMSKKRSSVASTRSKRKSSLASIKSRSLRKSRSVVCQNEESQQESADNSHEADDESSPRRKIRRSDPEKVEVVVCNQNDTMELFEDSLEPNVQGKVSQHTEEDLKSDDVAGQHPSSTSDKEVSPDAESTEEQHTCDSNEDEGNAAKIRRVDSCEEEEEAVTYSTPVRKPYLHGSGDDHSSGGSAVDSTPSPISTGGTHLRHKNYAASFLNALNQKRKDSGNYPTNTNGVITSFIKRNTPLKVKSVKERQKEMKQQIEKKQKKEEEIRRRREIERKQRLEEQKRKREERAMRAAEARKKRLQVQMEKAQQMEEKYEQKQALTEKVKEEKKKEEQNKKKIFNKKKAEAEARRKQEEEIRVQKLKEQEEEQRRHQEMLQRKKEFEEAERLRKLEEARRRQEERMAELEREREREIQAKKDQEMEKERERQRLKEQREKQREEERRKREEERRRLQAEKERKAREEEERRAREEMERIAREERERKAREEAERKAREEAERKAREEKERLRQQQDTAQHEQEKDEKERERLKANILAHNESQKKLNTTITMESESYELTPQRTYKPATEDNYDIGDLGSDDSTDDEDAPRKKIPKWAQGAALKATLLNQEFRPPNLDELFDAVDPPDLALMFKKKRSRFFKRTSSAVWDSPMLKTLV